MKLSRTEKILGIILLILWIALFTSVIESVAEVPRKNWIIIKLHRNYGISNTERNTLLHEYNILVKIAVYINNEMILATEKKDTERIRLLAITRKKYKIAYKDFLTRAEIFIKSKKGI